MPPPNPEHPARDAVSLAETVAAIDDATDPERFRATPAVANRIALDAAHRAYQAGQHDALSGLLTAEQAAHALGVTPAYVRQLAAKLGIGWQVGRYSWVFRPADVERMRGLLKPRRPRDEG